MRTVVIWLTGFDEEEYEELAHEYRRMEKDSPVRVRIVNLEPVDDPDAIVKALTEALESEGRCNH